MLVKLSEGLRILNRRTFFRGFRKHRGNAREICRKVIKECWNGTYFQTSTGHFRAFYMRDFCIAVPGLMKLGYEVEVHKTLQYALNIYSANKKITTTIANNKPVNMFSYSPDSLPMLLRSLRQAKAQELVKIYEPFIDQQVYLYLTNVLDEKTCLVRPLKFSSMKDNYYRKSSCYDNCMLAMLSVELDKLRLANPFRNFDIRAAIRKEFWNGKYFYDDLRKKKEVCGDANVFPFWCGVFSKKSMILSCMRHIEKAGLEKPFCLKYSAAKSHAMFPFNILLSDYEKNTIWLHLGLCYLEVCRKHRRSQFKKQMKSYKKLIEENGTFPEVFDSDGKVFKRLLYVCDEGMLWAAKYLELEP